MISNSTLRPEIKSRFVKSFSIAALAVLALSGCGSLEESIQSHTVTLENGGTVECVVVSGTNAVDCIDASYSGPNSNR